MSACILCGAPADNGRVCPVCRASIRAATAAPRVDNSTREALDKLGADEARRGAVVYEGETSPREPWRDWETEARDLVHETRSTVVHGSVMLSVDVQMLETLLHEIDLLQDDDDE